MKISDAAELYDEDMTVDITLDDGIVPCNIVTILEVDHKDYIVLEPMDDTAYEGETWYFEYSENPEDPNEEPLLTNITDENVLEAVDDAYDEFCDDKDFDDMKDTD